MNMLPSRSLCLIIMLSGLSELVKSRTLHLDSCPVNVHTHELRQYYSRIRSNLIMGDLEIGVKLLDKSMIWNVQDGQICCFLRLMLRFYIERVFNRYASPHSQNQRSSSALANAFVTIRRDMHKCHCYCAEETQRNIDSLHAGFIELEINQAAQKAMGELDTVLGWLEALEQSTFK